MNPPSATRAAAQQLGTNIRRLRQDQGKQLAEVADACGLSLSYISNIENDSRSTNHRTNPTIDVIARLAEVYGVHPAALLLPEGWRIRRGRPAGRP